MVLVWSERASNLAISNDVSLIINICLKILIFAYMYVFATLVEEMVCRRSPCGQHRRWKSSGPQSDQHHRYAGRRAISRMNGSQPGHYKQ